MNAGEKRGTESRNPWNARRQRDRRAATTGIHEWTESALKQPRDDEVLRDFLLRFAAVLPQETAPSKS